MNFLSKHLKAFINDENGANAIEYGLLAALIAVAIIVAAGAIGTNLSGLFNYISGKLTAPTTGGTGGTGGA